MAGDKCQLEPQNANALPVVNLVKVAGAYFSHCYDLVSPLVMPALCSAHPVYSTLFLHSTMTQLQMATTLLTPIIIKILFLHTFWL